MDVKSHVFQSEADQEYYWNLKAANGEIVACSPKGYGSEEEAGAELEVFRRGSKWKFATRFGAEKPRVGFNVFSAASGGWYWRFMSDDRIVAKGGESYTEKSSCEDSVERMKAANWL